MDISSTVRVIFSLIVVFLLLLLFLYYLRKTRGAGFSQNTGKIEILDKIYLDANKYLVLIQVSERQSLIAVAGDEIEHLWTEHNNELSSKDVRHS
jgi:flagellar biosynthetic protein FliO